MRSLLRKSALHHRSFLSPLRGVQSLDRWMVALPALTPPPGVVSCRSQSLMHFFVLFFSGTFFFYSGHRTGRFRFVPRFSKRSTKHEPQPVANLMSFAFLHSENKTRASLHPLKLFISASRVKLFFPFLSSRRKNHLKKRVFCKFIRFSALCYSRFRRTYFTHAPLVLWHFFWTHLLISFV